MFCYSGSFDDNAYFRIKGIENDKIDRLQIENGRAENFNIGICSTEGAGVSLS